MKRSSSSDLGMNGKANKTELVMDYDPAHFLRCHSKKNDSSDISTQVRHNSLYLPSFVTISGSF